MKRLLLILIALGCLTTKVAAQEGAEEGNPFWRNWFIEAGLDMTLQNPYGYNFGDVFPNGKSFGIDVAIGKRFSPQIGYRIKMNWENKLPLLENGHANWLAPFYQPGVNREKGGYLAFYGDLLADVQSLFGKVRTDRLWNVAVYPRMGVVYNFGIKKGAALLGAGAQVSYRLSDRWRVYADVAYNMCGSGFVGEEVEGTGTGSNSNGYLDLNLGVQVELGKQKTVETERYRYTKEEPRRNGFWENWFLQLGADMSLMNPYGCNFSNVFPKGNTFGLDIGVGKRFSREFTVRARINWENGLIKNGSLEWVPPIDNPQENYEKGGFAIYNLDAMLNFHEAFAPREVERTWNLSGYLRCGLINQFCIGSASPLLGGGLENTYKLNDKWRLYGDIGYQVTTSESSGGMTGMEVATGTNGFLNIELGAQLEL